MKSTYIHLDDPRVTLKATRPGRVFSLEGKSRSEDYPFPHTEHENGFHLEPRMTSVFAPPKSFNLNPGDFAKITVEHTPLVGIVLEAADHHYDLKVLIDGRDIYQEFHCLSTYLPSSDGFGKVHWLLLDRGKHDLELIVTSQHNRMLDASGISPSHACISGFLLMPEIQFPPPVYHNWMYTQDPIPPDTRGRISSFNNNLIPAHGSCYLMDLIGQGSLDTLVFQVDHPVVLEIMDGGSAQPEYPHDFPSWIRRCDLSNTESGALSSVISITQSGGSNSLQVVQSKPVSFASRLIVRLQNPGDQDCRVSNLYMEGKYRCV